MHALDEKDNVMVYAAPGLRQETAPTTSAGHFSIKPREADSIIWTHAPPIRDFPQLEHELK